MLVFRVETTDGEGPYTSGEFSEQFEMQVAHADNAHPSPNHRLSGLDYIAYEERCGCDSPENLLDWFKGWMEKMAADDFVVTIYSDRWARVGNHGQVCFKPGRAQTTIKDRLSIDDFLGLFAPQNA